MIEKIKYGIVDKLILEDKILQEERELYLYSVETLFEKILAFLTIFVIAVLCKSVLVGCVFYISFKETRKYAGGYHANTFVKCYLLSNLCFFCTIVLIKFSIVELNYYRILAGILAIYLLYIGPVDCENKQFDEEEKKIFYRCEIYNILIIAVVCVFLGVFNLEELEKAVESAVILNGMTSLIVMIKRRKYGSLHL